MNSVVKQWIVRRKYLLMQSDYRLLVLLENGKYFFSCGETGEFSELTEDEAKVMIERPL